MLEPPGKDTGLSPRSECPHYLKDTDSFPALLPNASSSLEELANPSGCDASIQPTPAAPLTPSEQLGSSLCTFLGGAGGSDGSDCSSD